jgi:hypothetical protein
LLRRDRGDVFTQFGVEKIPTGPDMAVERVRFVLDQNGDLTKPRINTIAQSKVDDAVFPSEGDGWLRTMVRKWKKTLAFPAGQDHRKNILHGLDSSRTNMK